MLAHPYTSSFFLIFSFLDLFDLRTTSRRKKRNEQLLTVQCQMTRTIFSLIIQINHLLGNEFLRAIRWWWYQCIVFHLLYGSSILKKSRRENTGINLPLMIYIVWIGNWSVVTLPWSGSVFILIVPIYRLGKKKKNCRDPGLNQGPSDLQSDALPTELSRLDMTPTRFLGIASQL